MIDAAEASGELKPGGTIVEPTSATPASDWPWWGTEARLQVRVRVPDKVSEDKRNVLRAYGAEVVVCPTAVAPEHPDSYYNVSDRLVKEIPGAWKPNQYANPGGPDSHYETTGPEIWRDTEGKVTHFVAGVGTGGTITGTGRYLKEISGGKVKIIGAARKARSTRVAPVGRIWSRVSARTSGPPPTTRPCPTRSSPSRTPIPSR
ncbi:pyridoxal-phosphate dependent enzyme [Rhodococcus hoagii]|nr:pyridoxal-phosphate dependent enzyme [Prescottella equi]